MDAKATAGIPRAFVSMPEPRHHNIRHKLIDILTIALFAVICGAEDWVAVDDAPMQPPADYPARSTRTRSI